MVWGMEGVWCGIVICGGFGTEGDKNNEFSGEGVCTTRSFCAAPILGGRVYQLNYLNILFRGFAIGFGRDPSASSLTIWQQQ